MALTDKFVDQNVQFPSHILMKDGAEVLNFKPAYIPDTAAGADDWAALVEGGYFYDSVGTGRKLNGQRSYFTSTEIVNQMIADAITNADARHYFDPSTQAVPVSPNGPIKSGEVFVVTTAGEWNGLALNPGDILEATADITGTPQLNDFLLNQAASGLASVEEATTTLAGVVTVTETVRTNGSATHEKVTTEKAVADALIALQTALMQAIADVQALLQAQIDTNSSAISALGDRVTATETDITALQAKEVEQDSRLTIIENETDDLTTRVEVLEEWTQQGVTIALGNGSDTTFVANIPSVEFKNVEDVVVQLKASDGNGGYTTNGAIFPCTVYSEGGVQKVKAIFASGVPAGKYAVRITGLAKAAA